VVPSWYHLDAPKVEKTKRRWPMNRLFRWVSYDATGFDEFTYHQVKDVRPRERLWYWRPWHDAQFLYNTHNFSELLSHLDESGVCMTCGGTRRRAACVCDRPQPGARRPEAEDGGPVGLLGGVDGRLRHGPVQGPMIGRPRSTANG